MTPLQGRRVVLIGDSWVVGPPGVALAAALEAQGATVVRDGIVGAGVISTVARLRSILPEIEPGDTVLILMGVNDVAGPRARDSYVTLREALTAAGAKVYVMSNATISDPAFPYRVKVRTIETWQHDVFGHRALALSSSADDEWFNTTHFHLTPEGAQAWIARILPSVMTLLDDSPTATFGRTLLGMIPGGITSFARI